ncbi:hypothetical protein Tco_0710073 [Tanacetum coccineum]
MIQERYPSGFNRKESSTSGEVGSSSRARKHRLPQEENSLSEEVGVEEDVETSSHVGVGFALAWSHQENRRILSIGEHKGSNNGLRIWYLRLNLDNRRLDVFGIPLLVEASFLCTTGFTFYYSRKRKSVVGFVGPDKATNLGGNTLKIYLGFLVLGWLVSLNCIISFDGCFQYCFSSHLVFEERELGKVELGEQEFD